MKIREILENQTDMHANHVIFEIDGGKLVVWPNAPHAPRSASVIEFIVPEASRNQGIGNKLVAMADKQFPDLGAQVSSIPSLKAFYNSGFRNPKLGPSSFEELVEAFKENWGSLFVANTDREGNKWGTQLQEGFILDPDYAWFYNDDDEQEARKLVNVKVSTFDNAWKTGSHGNQYIGSKGTGSIKTRYQDFGKWVSQAKEPIKAATVSVDDWGDVAFNNGRHRYCWLRDQGAKTIPMAMDRESIKNAKKFGLI
jgi:hypothetical protein